MPISQTEDFFRGRLDQMIDLRHPLAVLSTHMPWQEIEASLAGLIARRLLLNDSSFRYGASFVLGREDIIL